MGDRILTARFELSKGKHLYVFDPAGFDKEVDERSPVFEVDNRVLSVDEALDRAYEGCDYLVCGCEDYQERERRFDAGESYKWFQDNPEFGWDCVATCNHITLVKRYFARPLMDKVLETIAEQESNPALATAQFLQSREAGFFPRIALKSSADYLKQHNI